jgi:hypothetical protein
MPMLAASQCFDKWIRKPQELLRFQAENAAMVRAGVQPRQLPHYLSAVEEMQRQGKFTDTLRAKVKGAEKAIQGVLENATMYEQFERDVAMWYGYCRDNTKGAQLCLRLFTALQKHGVFYKNVHNVWGDFGMDFPETPVASLLSRGGRILFLLPKGMSKLRQVGSDVKAIVKGLTVDPLKATFGRDPLHTLRFKNTAATVAVNALLRPTGLAAVGSVLSVGHKVRAAGDDRIFDCLTGGDLHSRAVATHSTVYCDDRHAQNLLYHRRLWFTEEKAAGGHHHLSNLRDGMMGRHFYKNVALGGVGNINPFSGVTIDKDGGHGHLYVNYRAPWSDRQGCMLVGVEGCAPGFSDQTGAAHDHKYTKPPWSPTGGKKWAEVELGRAYFFDPVNRKNEVEQFVCDLSHMSTEVVVATIGSKTLSVEQLHSPVRPVRPLRPAV